MSSDPKKAGSNVPEAQQPQRPQEQRHAQHPSAGTQAPEPLDLEWEPPAVTDTPPAPAQAPQQAAAPIRDDLEEVELEDDLEMVDLDEALEPQPVQAATPTAPAASGGVTCNHCGHVHATDEKFCDACGLRIDKVGAFAVDEEKDLTLELDDDDASPVVCRECGVRNKPGTTLCINCGVRIAPEEII